MGSGPGMASPRSRIPPIWSSTQCKNIAKRKRYSSQTMIASNIKSRKAGACIMNSKGHSIGVSKISSTLKTFLNLTSWWRRTNKEEVISWKVWSFLQRSSRRKMASKGPRDRHGNYGSKPPVQHVPEVSNLAILLNTSTLFRRSYKKARN